MRVSWIDQDEINSLLARLDTAAPAAKSENIAWETHTLPDRPPQPLAHQPPALVETSVADHAVAEKQSDTSAEVEKQIHLAEQASDGSQVHLEVAGTPSEPVDETPVEATTEPEVATTEAEEVSPEVERIRNRLREVREKAAKAGLLKLPPAFAPAPPKPIEKTVPISESEPVPSADSEPAAVAPESSAPDAAAPAVDDHSSFEVPLGSVLERLEAFAQWATKRVLPGELILLDEHGDVLWGTQAKSTLVLSAMMAASAATHGSAEAIYSNDPPVIRKVQPSERELVVVSSQTRVGLIHLAVDHPGHLPDTEAKLLEQALRAAVDAGA